MNENKKKAKISKIIESLLFNIGFYLFLHTNNNKRFKNIDIMNKLIKEGEKNR